LLLIGDGPERRRLEEQSRLLGLGAHVVFAGYQPEPRRFLDLMDVFVLPSRSEGLSVALLEAMSAGCPAMVTDVGENRRVIADGEAGWLLPSDETKWGPFILTQAIYRRNRPGALEPSEAAGDESGRARKVIAAAEKRVRDVYGAERTLSSYEEEYRALVLP
jgi:glycosyltransferase involved in cell wall biosynthesis